ncbi:hypothetical protein QFZ42_001847 [Variovorax paradoxus]|uniref:hypothetical protein n=1 Tax=Variovorax paradoxus TaxID=34073 RepID=UPI002790F9E6|nr:hypothetical protein [Variovorax paradoxus]MDQ0570013.1 hypothetical protein [Variovorax paradoxus]
MNASSCFSFMSSSAGEAAGTLSARDLRVLEALRPFLGAEAEALFEAHGRSLHRLVGFARDTSGIGWLQMLAACAWRGSCSWRMCVRLRPSVPPTRCRTI